MKRVYKTTYRTTYKTAHLGSKANEILLKISGTGQTELNVTVPIVLHHGRNQGNDNTGIDVFLNKKSKTDFSDIMFTDAYDNELKHYVVSKGNYEIFTEDNENIGVTFIDTLGFIWAVDAKASKNLIKSEDGGLTWNLIYSAPDTIRSIFIDSRGYVFLSVFQDGAYRSTDGITFNRVIDFTDVLGYYLPNSIDEDLLGNLFIGRYQTPFGVKIYKSEDSGATWSVVYAQTDNQHVHSLKCDRYTGHIYAGLDGGAYKIIKSINNGADWVDIYSGLDANPTAIYCGDGFRLFGSEPINGGSILRTTNDADFEVVLPTNHMVSWIYEINGVLFATGDVMDKVVYPVILKSEDDGVTWETIRIFKQNKRFGWGYHQLGHKGRPINESSDIIYCGHRSDVNDSLPSIKIKSNQNTYESFVYLNIPVLDAAGGIIKLKFGQTNIISDIDTFFEPQISNLELHYKLDEGSGTDIIDSSINGINGVLSLGTGNWNNYEVKKIGAIFPPVKRTGKSFHLNGDGYITVSGSNLNPIFQVNKNFSLVCWINNITDGSSKPIFHMAGNKGWYLYFLGPNFYPCLILPGIGSYSCSDLGLHIYLKDTFTHQIGIIITNDTPARVKFIINGIITDALQFDSDFETLSYYLRIGYKASTPYIVTDIDDIRWYSKELSDIEVKSLYESRNCLQIEPNVSNK